MVAPIFVELSFSRRAFFLNSSQSTPRIAQYCLITWPSDIAQPGVCQTSDNKQFDGMWFNSSSQITHICLTLSSGTPERELQMFLARCLHGREHSKPVQAVTERPFVIFFGLIWEQACLVRS